MPTYSSVSIAQRTCKISWKAHHFSFFKKKLIGILYHVCVSSPLSCYLIANTWILPTLCQALSSVPDVTILKVLWGRGSYYFHLKAEKTEVQRGQVNCSWTHSYSLCSLAPESMFPTTWHTMTSCCTLWTTPTPVCAAHTGKVRQDL